MGESLLNNETVVEDTATETTTETTTQVPEGLPEFLHGIDPELANEPMLKSFQDVNSLVKSYVNAQKMVGKNKIVVPDEHATKEDWSEVYKKLGLPDKDNYKVDFGDAQFEDEFKNQFAERAHEAGLLPHQAQEVFNFWNEQIMTANQQYTEQVQKQQEEGLNNLRKEWGNGFDKELAVAQQTLNTFGDDDFKQYLDQSGLGNDPQLIKLLNKIGKSLNEDTFDRNTVKHLGITVDEARDKSNEIMGNPAHPYWHKSHPSHKQAVADMLKYNEILTSTEEN